MFRSEAQGAKLGDPLTTSYERFLKRNAATYTMLDSVGRHANLVRYEPASQLCNSVVPDRCIVSCRGAPLYFDGNHLSTEGASIALAGLASVLFSKEDPAVASGPPQ